MIRKRRPIDWLILLVMTGLAQAAAAGMRPHPTLTEISRFRLDVISFFAVLILALAGVVRVAWNALARDFAALPRLTYGRALAALLLWGLLFVIVLAMISGARELMTPGAWEKRDGGGYRLAAGSEPAQLESARRRQLERLRDALWTYAKGHGGNFPPHDLVPEIGDDVWETIHPSRLHYLYIPNRRADRGKQTVAYEPGVYGEQRLTLRSDGTIAFQKLEDVREEINAEGK